MVQPAAGVRRLPGTDDLQVNLAARQPQGLIPVVTGVEANTLPVCTSRPASSAREPWGLYSCS